MFIAKEPVSEKDFSEYYALRFEVLRKPWGQPEGSEKDGQEDESIHACIKNETGKVVAVCRLQMNSSEEAQIRYMAVDSSYQGKGLGRKIIYFLENKAKQLGAKKMILHARENAVDFYRSCDYTLVEESYLLWGQIQHYLMEKSL